MADPSYRVLIASESPLLPSSSGNSTAEIAKRLIAKGHEVAVVAWDQTGGEIHHPDGYIIVSGGAQFGGFPLNGVSEPTILDREVHSLKPDVIYSDAPMWALQQVVKTSNGMKIPLVAHLGVRGFPLNHKHVNLLSMVHTPLWKSQFAKEQFTSLIERYTADGLGVMEDSKTELLDRYIDNFGEVIPMGADSELFHGLNPDAKKKMRESLGIGHWDTVFISVGNNNTQRQYPRLFEAFKMLIMSLDDDVKGTVGMVVHCGDPRGAMMDGNNLIELAESMGLSNAITFSDQSVHPRDGLSITGLSNLYDMCDCFVTATSGAANGNSLAEAMMAGLPVIMPDNTMARDRIGLQRGWVAQQSTSLMAKDQTYYGLVDEHALKEAMRAFMDEDEEATQERADKCRSYALEHLDWDIVTERLIDALGEAINTPHPHTKEE
tara:strand:- start:9653 stop:10957 length:1305 start_codon:yes stop_codon:yes gene_type:complete